MSLIQKRNQSKTDEILINRDSKINFWKCAFSFQFHLLQIALAIQPCDEFAGRRRSMVTTVIFSNSKFGDFDSKQKLRSKENPN